MIVYYVHAVFWWFCCASFTIFIDVTQNVINERMSLLYLLLLPLNSFFQVLAVMVVVITHSFISSASNIQPLLSCGLNLGV